MTRAEYLLNLFEFGLSTTMAASSNGPDLSSRAWRFRGAGAALTAGLIAHQIHRARAQTRDKVRQAGLGNEHTQARAKLRSLRTQHLLSLGADPKVGDQIRAQKAKVSDIENKGLERYHQGVVSKPSADSTPSVQRDRPFDYNRNPHTSFVM